MKPKFRNYIRRALPGMIVLPAMTVMLPSVSEATIYPTLDPFGNVLMNDATLNGANTFIASGGSSSTPTVTIASTVNLTGHTGNSTVGNITYVNGNTTVLSITGNRTYTVTVASGAVLRGTNHDGINSTASVGFTLNNSGTIAGGGNASQGVDIGSTASLTSVINNLAGGVITANNTVGNTTDSYAVWFRGDTNGNLTNVSNSGTIQSIAGNNSVGIQGANFLKIENLRTGTITGLDHAIRAGGNLTVTNLVGGSITSTRNHGIVAGDSASITNNGSITGGNTTAGDGVKVGLSARIINATNSITIDDTTVAFSAGRIVGRGGSGIQLDNSGYVENQNLGYIDGYTYGILGANSSNSVVSDNIRIDNRAGGRIIGSNLDGIRLDDAAVITNGATIFADGGDTYSTILGGSISGWISGIRLGDDGNITNGSGAGIHGGTSGIRAGGNTTITNAGWIGQKFLGGNGTPLVSIELDNGANRMNLNTGSVLWGDVIGGKEADTINMDGGWDSYGYWLDSVEADNDDDFAAGNLINGNVTGIETLNKTGAGLGLLIGNDHAIDQITVLGGALYINTSENNSLGPVFSKGTNTINVGASPVEVEIPMPDAVVVGPGSPIIQLSTPFTEIGGTGTWHSDINLVSENSVISAGGIPIQFDSSFDPDEMHGGGGDELATLLDVMVLPPTLLSPLSAVGQVTITGNVTHVPGSFIRFDVIPGSKISNGINSDLIIQTGDATYDLSVDIPSVVAVEDIVFTGAGLIISATDNDEVISDGQYVVVDSEQEILNFDPDMEILVQFNPNINDRDSGFIGSEVWGPSLSDNTVLGQFFITPSLDDNGTDLVFEVDHDFADLPGLNANQSSLGAALDDAVGDGDELTQNLIAALDYSSLLFVEDTLDSLVPDASLAQASAVASSNYGLHRRVQNHLSAVRDGGGEVIETPASTDAKGGMIPAQTTTSGGGMGNVWGAFSYDWKDAEFDNNFEGEDGSFTAGVDYRIAPNLLLGLLLEGSQGEYDYTGGSSDVDSLRVAAYGTYGGATGFYSDFLVGYGNHDLDSTRALGGILAVGKGSFVGTSTEADSLQALLTVGYTMENNGIKHGPFAGFEYQNVDVDGHTTTGVFPIAVDGYDVDSLRFLIGYRAEATYGQFTPFASLAYAHEFEDGPISATASLPGGSTFGVTGGGLDSAILLSIGTGYSITSNLDLNVSYNGEFSTGDGVDSNGGSIGLNYSF